MAIQQNEFVDYYKLLEIEPNASSIQIRKAFLQKAKQHHPDVGGSTESMRLLNTAYKTLTSYMHKAAYDLLHRFHTGKKEVEYNEIGPQAKSQSSSVNLSDEYIDWFIDAVYVEYSNVTESKVTFGKLVKKIFNIYS